MQSSPNIQRWGPWTTASSPIFSPRTNQQRELMAVLSRDAGSTSNSPAGQQNPSPENNGRGACLNTAQLGPQAVMAHQSPQSSSAQNFPLATGILSNPNFFSPSPISLSPLFQNQDLAASPPQGINIARNLFGGFSAATFPNPINTNPNIPSPPIYFDQSPNYFPFQAHANYIVSQNYFQTGPSPNQVLSKNPTHGQSSRQRNRSPNIQKKKRKANHQREEETEGQGKSLSGFAEAKTG
ncbi:unnamed protein product [Linum trigynum]|uniref:Uncharacterized protein n=1 Tax=Linum trigynum TaxID=586398 RepID=A0AAV2EFN5_9ROSI